MSLVARCIYRALVWKERQRAARLQAGLPEPGATTPHLETGRRGETLAYWHLRRAGYTIVGRNRRPGAEAGELDLIGWDGPVLAFVEVKTRTSSPEASGANAVTPEQRRRIVLAAQRYLRALRNREVRYRFDVANVVWQPGTGLEVRLVKDAFKA